MKKNYENLNIEVVIWDLDGTLYPWDEAFWREDFKAVAKSIEDLGVLTFEEAYNEAKRSFDIYNLTFEVFIEKYGIPFNDLELRHIVNFDASKLTKLPELYEFFEKSDSKHHYIVSDAPKKWVFKILSTLGYNNFFTTSHVLSKENLRYKKRVSIEWIEKIINCKKYTPARILIVDNTLDNLLPLKEAGYKTYFIDDKNYRKSIEKLLKMLTNLTNSN